MKKDTLAFPKKKAKDKTISLAKVQQFFNKSVCLSEKVCFTCGSILHPQASHYYAVGGSSGLRFNRMNVHRMCAGCHIAHHNRDPELYYQAMLAKYGYEAMQKLRIESKQAHKWTAAERESIFFESKKIIDLAKLSGVCDTDID